MNHYAIEIPILSQALALGAISVAQVIAWADRNIEQEANPANWLLAIAMAGSASVTEVSSLLKGASVATAVDDDVFLAIIAGTFLHQRQTADKTIAALLERFCYVDWQERGPLRQELYLIDDEWGWSPATAIARLEKLLRPYLPQYDSLLEELGLTNGGR